MWRFLNSITSSRSLFQKRHPSRFFSRNLLSTDAKRTITEIPDLQLFQRAVNHNDKTALVSGSQRNSFSYSDLIRHSAQLHERLVTNSTNFFPNSKFKDLREQRVALLCENSYSYARAQWAIWRAGGIFVPLCTSHPPPELEYVLKDSESSIALVDEKFESILKPLTSKYNIRCLTLENESELKRGTSFTKKDIESMTSYTLDLNRGAMVIYTSGTTGKPKGVLTTHKNTEAQILSMIEPWAWSSSDHILHTLPLHHVHGVINVLTCALWAGAVCEILPHFDAKTVWECFTRKTNAPNLYMAVPTIYAKLISEYDHMTSDKQKEATEACQRIRLMVSGSMALPESIMKKWQQVSGHVLLERYGMTEIGMALSNPLKGERIPGTVGFPLPGVEVRIVNDISGEEVQEGEPGELQVAGPCVFREYWKRPDATRDSFDGKWFKTGDIAVNIGGRYSILGRASVDIIKSGGYKISALEVERELLEHHSVSECAVVGIPDATWGQIVAAIIVHKKGKPDLDIEGLRKWAKERMASYKVPKKLLVVDSLPRNPMGKVNKKELVKLFHHK